MAASHDTLDGEALALSRDAIELYYSNNLTDGLPVVPITGDVVNEFLAHTSRQPAEVLFEIPHLNRSCTVELAAANAAMAGCLPQYFPVVIAAWEAISREAYPKAGIWQSTTGVAPLLIVNGPIRTSLGINSAGNILGSGIRANATIGRAIRLGAINIFGIHSHHLDQATHGTPARYSACFAENEEQSPWEPLHVAHGFAAEDSTVATATIRSTMHVEARHTSDPEQLAHDLLNTMTRSGAMMNEFTSSILIISPEHAAVFAGAGWGRETLRDFLYSNGRTTAEALARVGKDGISSAARWRLPVGHPDAVGEPPAGDAEISLFRSPEGIQIVVAGADNAGVSTVVDVFSSGESAQENPLAFGKVD